MAKRRVKKTKVSIKRGNDFLSMFILIVLLLVFASMRFGGFLTGSAITDVPLQNEVWIAPCNIDSAGDMAGELKWNYGCETNYCNDAAYGLELPFENFVKLNCGSSDQRAKWKEACDEAFKAIC